MTTKELDKAVAEALGHTTGFIKNDRYFLRKLDYWFWNSNSGGPYSPTTNWEQGGRIIEEYGIDFSHFYDGSKYPNEVMARITNPAYIESLPDGTIVVAVGATPLIAAMKAFVESKK